MFNDHRPFVGKLTDTLGKYMIFCIGSILTMFMVVIYCNLGLTPLWMVILLNVDYVHRNFFQDNFVVGPYDRST